MEFTTGRVFKRSGQLLARPLIQEGLMPERRCELEFRLQPMVKCAPHRLAFLLPNEIGAHCNFIFGCSRTSFRHMLLDMLSVRNWRAPGHLTFGF
jgi:hypothetical protein